MTTATPTFSDMLGARCELNFARGGISTPMVATATVTDAYQHRGLCYFVIASDNPRLSGRHFSEVEFEESLIRYIHQPVNGTAMTAVKAITAA